MTRVGFSNYKIQDVSPWQNDENWRQHIDRKYWDHPYHALRNKIEVPNYKGFLTSTQEAAARTWNILERDFQGNPKICCYPNDEDWCANKKPKRFMRSSAEWGNKQSYPGGSLKGSKKRSTHSGFMPGSTPYHEETPQTFRLNDPEMKRSASVPNLNRDHWLEKRSGRRDYLEGTRKTQQPWCPTFVRVMNI